MSNIPLDIPPGFYRNGTEYSAQGRWRDGNLVRFFRDQGQPVGGWTTIPFDLELNLPQYVEFDGNDAYDDTFTSSGNLVTAVMRFNIASFTGNSNVDTMMMAVGPGSDPRLKIRIYSSDYFDTDYRNKIEVQVQSSTATVLCDLFSLTAFADSQDHILFFSFDGDNGEATFVIDGVNADDTGHAQRVAPTAGTLDSGASSNMTIAAEDNTPTRPITGNMGFIGYRDAYLTNWADFMDGNLPKEIDETGWAEWGAQPAYWAENGALTTNAGSGGNMSAVGDPTLVDSDESVTDFLPGYTRRMITWRDSNDQRWLAIGTTRGLFAWDGSTIYDITPSGLDSGEQGVALGPGYGSGLYGTETYGTARTQVINTIVYEPGAWALDNWGDKLVGVPNWDGQLYEWDPDSPSTVAALVTGDVGSGSAESPERNRSLVVTNERHLVLIGSGNWSGVIWNSNPRNIAWSDAEDNTTWDPLATNAAGDLELKTEGVAQCGVRWQKEVIIWTNIDVHRMSYVGAPYYYGIQSVGAKAGIISQTAYVTTDNFIFWVGPEGFHIYDGTVRELDCEVWDYYIDRLNKAHQDQIAVGHNPRFNEIWIFYPSNDSTALNDSYVIWNYEDNHWVTGTLSRSAWNDALIWENPIAARPYGGTTLPVTLTKQWNHDEAYDVVSDYEPPGVSYTIKAGTFAFQDGAGASYGTEDTDYYVDYISGKVTSLSTGAFADDEEITCTYTLEEGASPRTLLFFHEDGYNDEAVAKPVRDCYMTAAPFEIANGDRLAVVKRVWQDTGRQDDLDPTLNSNAVQVEFETRLAPEASGETHGPYTLDTSRGYTDVRFTGRQVELTVRQTKNELWRIGRMRLDVKEGSHR